MHGLRHTLRETSREWPSHESKQAAELRQDYDETPARIESQMLQDPIEEPPIFRDPIMTTSIDFLSEDGFIRTANKKAKKAAKAAQQAKWGNDDDGEDPPNGEGNGEDKGGDGGDFGAGGDGDKKDDADGDKSREANPDDEWESFMPAKSKKKGKKGKAEEPAPAAPGAEKFDAFHEISLGDTGPSLDLSFDTGTDTKTTGFGAWGSNWNTGSTTTWDFSATTNATSTTDTKKESEVENNPWSLNRGKPKKKNNAFSFGVLDEEDAKPLDPDPLAETKPAEDDFGFTSVSKKDKKKKKNAFSWEPEEPKEPEPAPIVEGMIEMRRKLDYSS